MEIVRRVNCNRFLQVCQLSRIQDIFSSLQVRHAQTKHWNPKFKRLRKYKFVKIDIPDLQEKTEELSQEEIRSRMKEKGILPPRPWLERPFHISCTGGVFEAYVPPEGDGKKSFVTTGGAKQKFEFLEKKSKSMMAVRKIRNYEEEFNTDDFAQQSQDIYTNAHKYMAEKDRLKLREFVTERCYPEMTHNIRDKTIHWSFIQSLEPPKVVHARCTDIITKDNLFAQVTVRFHTQQKLAIYDRFGRLMHGSEMLVKDVLEYVVFEKHISNEYGTWRLHDKIIPDWLPKKQPAPITYRISNEHEQENVKANEIESIKVEEQKLIPANQSTDGAKSKIVEQVI